MRKVVEKIKTHTFYVQQLVAGNRARLRDNIEKCGGATEAADDNTAERCTLYKYGYTRASTRPRPWTHTNQLLSQRTQTRCIILQTG